MEEFHPKPNYNIRRDYSKLQGVTHPADLTHQIPRDINSRYITVQNSSTRPIGFAITSYISGPYPSIDKILVGGEIAHLGINSHGNHSQYIWILDPSSGKPVSDPCLIRSNGRDLVLRDGLNKWFVQFFQSSYGVN